MTHLLEQDAGMKPLEFTSPVHADEWLGPESHVPGNCVGEINRVGIPPEWSSAEPCSRLEWHSEVWLLCG
jgi:hypothetical protein